MISAHRTPTWLAALTAGACIAALLIPVEVASARRCQDAFLRNPNGTVYNRTYLLIAQGTSCATARKVARRYLSRSDSADGPGRPYGYTCRPWRDGAGVDCRKGRRYISWGTH